MKFTLARALVASALSLAALGVQAKELRLSVETPPGHIRNEAAQKWADAIAAKTNGGLTVTVFPAAQLYKSADAVRALASGALDMSIQASPTLSRFEPNLSVITLPMFFGASRDQVRDILDGPLGDELYAMVAKKGIVVPAGRQFEFAPNNSAYTTSKQVSSYAEMAGLKLATPPSPVVVAMMKAMGAAAVPVPRSEVVLQLTQGQIDGMGSVTDLTITGGKMWEAGIKYAFADNAGWGTYIPLVSKATMDGLSADEQKAVNDAWAETVGWAREQAAADLDAARAKMEANGITYTVANPDDVAAMRETAKAAQADIVASGGMDAEFVARVEKALSGM